jgi:hypothetical protein
MIRLNFCVAIIQTLLCLAAIVAISLKSEDKNDLMISSRDLQLYRGDRFISLCLYFQLVGI